MKTQRGIIFLIILFLKKYKETSRRRYEKEREKERYGTYMQLYSRNVAEENLE